jgi:hypothetical protein
MDASKNKKNISAVNGGQLKEVRQGHNLWKFLQNCRYGLHISASGGVPISNFYSFMQSAAQVSSLATLEGIAHRGAFCLTFSCSKEKNTLGD